MTSRYFVRKQENPTRFAELKTAIEKAGGVVSGDAIHVEEWWTIEGHEDGKPLYVFHYGVRSDPPPTMVTLTITKARDHDGG